MLSFIKVKNMKAIDIANKITEISGINLFQKSRKRNVIEHRGLLCYILRDKLKMRWQKMEKFYTSQGWPVNHATLINSYRKWYIYKTNQDVIKILNQFHFEDEDQDEIDKVEMLETKCNNQKKKLEDPLVKAVLELPVNKREQVKEKLDLLKKEWAWKEKVL
ncbi:MAG: hypothetical protein Unbinned306contig1002_19 [Prokaryotic dsDNA virus sp.]|nr:MAG: hypothetical protein Unbinned306contig1002_19 [Prokaryotic dsDNA virus sp.]|tara:strand:- start:19635 stop:20120 length:486 start_codon:yes stop_codon:yes gene_type:complete